MIRCEKRKLQQYPLTIALEIRDDCVDDVRKFLSRSRWEKDGDIFRALGDSITELHFLAIGVHVESVSTPLLILEATSDLKPRVLISRLFDAAEEDFVELVSACGKQAVDRSRAEAVMRSGRIREDCFFSGHRGRPTGRISDENDDASAIVRGLIKVNQEDPDRRNPMRAARVTLLKNCWVQGRGGEPPPTRGPDWRTWWAKPPFAGLIILLVGFVALGPILVVALILSAVLLIGAAGRFTVACVPVIREAVTQRPGVGTLVYGLMLLAALALIFGLVCMILSWSFTTLIWQYFGTPLLVLVAAAAAAGLIGLALFYTEHWERGVLRASSPPDESPRQTRGQNHYFNMTYVKPNRLRLFLLWTWLRSLELLGELHFNKGKLGSISTIHFARWVIIPDRRHKGHKLLFCSNFDFSADSYVGDFANRARLGVNGVWSHTVGFPVTRWIFFGGSRNRDQFTDFARSMEFETSFWFQRYGELSVVDVNTNSSLRDSLDSAFKEGRADEETIMRVLNR